ncbi:hypothetical protein [Massilia eburnea]|uniref:hypothetical protein n=1 Tax=Massilia eburnea TaxID=1776165 RepID=UPI003D6AFFD6
MLKIAKEFGVSSSYLARVCTRLNVPRPERGYWARIAAGQRAPKADLPEALPGDEISWNPGGGGVAIQGPTDARLETTVAARRTAAKASLKGPHDLIATAKPHFLAGNLSREGNYLKPAKRNLVDLVVTTESLDPALSLANELFNAFERKGHRVILAALNESVCRPEVDTRDTPTKQPSYNNLWGPARKTVLYVNGTPIGLTIFEITEATAMRYKGDGEYVKEADFVMPKGAHWEQFHWRSVKDIPSGRLCLQAYSSYYTAQWSRQWKERHPGDFLKKVTALVKEVIACEAEAAEAIATGKQRAEAEDMRWKAQQEQWRREELQRKREEAEKASRNELETLLVRCERWDRLDRLIEAVTMQAADASDESKARLDMLIDAAKRIEGRRPTLEDFLAWKTPHERG